MRIFSGILLESGLAGLAAETIGLAAILGRWSRLLHPKFDAGKVVVVAADLAPAGLSTRGRGLRIRRAPEKQRHDCQGHECQHAIHHIVL